MSDPITTPDHVCHLGKIENGKEYPCTICARIWYVGTEREKPQTTTFEKRIKTTLDSLAKGHFIQWEDGTYTKINVPTIEALQKLWFGDKHAGI